MITFRVSRADAEVLAKEMSEVDLLAIKRESQNEIQHPVYTPMNEQWEGFIQHLIIRRFARLLSKQQTAGWLCLGLKNQRSILLPRGIRTNFVYLDTKEWISFQRGLSESCSKTPDGKFRQPGIFLLIQLKPRFNSCHLPVHLLVHSLRTSQFQAVGIEPSA